MEASSFASNVNEFLGWLIFGFIASIFAFRYLNAYHPQLLQVLLGTHKIESFEHERRALPTEKPISEHTKLRKRSKRLPVKEDPNKDPGYESDTEEEGENEVTKIEGDTENSDLIISKDPTSKTESEEIKKASSLRDSQHLMKSINQPNDSKPKDVRTIAEPEKIPPVRASPNAPEEISRPKQGATPIVPKCSQEGRAHSGTPYPEKSGWMKISSRINISPTRTWKHRYFHLENGYLAFYKNEDMELKDCYGFIKLSGCKIYTKHQFETKSLPAEQRVVHRSVHKILIRHPTGKRIYHRKGYDPKKKASPSKFIFNGRSSVCKLKINDVDQEAESWLLALQQSTRLPLPQAP